MYNRKIPIVYNKKLKKRSYKTNKLTFKSQNKRKIVKIVKKKKKKTLSTSSVI